MDIHRPQHAETTEAMENTTPARPSRLSSPIIELRQYTLHPGQRDVLIDLFEREFIESQEAVGITLIGQFRDLDNPDRFVWIRGFPDMPARKASLQAFYGGPVWQKYRNAANATMVDSDNVLLLRPAHPASAFHLAMTDRPALDATTIPPGLVVATILSLNGPLEAAVSEAFQQVLMPILARQGASALSYFVPEESANTFPILPVREGEHVFVWFSLFRDQSAHHDHVRALTQIQEWREAWEAVRRRLTSTPVVLRLSPTARSLLHG